MQESADAILGRAVDAARRICEADAAFAVLRDGTGRYPVCNRLGLTQPEWNRIAILAGRGMGGLVLTDRQPRVSHDYAREPNITPDYVPIMSREHMRGVAVVPIDDLTTGHPGSKPVGLIYVSSTRRGAPGDLALTEVRRAAEMAAVGLERVGHSQGRRATSSLSEREVQVLRLLDKGYSNAIIARRLVISETTVKAHLRSILRKLNAPSRLAAVAAARQHNIV